MPTNVEVPGMGDSVREAVLLRWHKNDGDAVTKDEMLCELETDKANVDLPAPAAGVLKRVAQQGATVKIGDTIAQIEESAGKPAASKSPAAAPTAPAAAPNPTSVSTTDLSPAVR